MFSVHIYVKVIIDTIYCECLSEFKPPVLSACRWRWWPAAFFSTYIEVDESDQTFHEPSFICHVSGLIQSLLYTAEGSVTNWEICVGLGVNSTCSAQEESLIGSCSFATQRESSCAASQPEFSAFQSWMDVNQLCAGERFCESLFLDPVKNRLSALVTKVLMSGRWKMSAIPWSWSGPENTPYELSGIGLAVLNSIVIMSHHILLQIASLCQAFQICLH